jgi:hypothetical protein
MPGCPGSGLLPGTSADALAVTSFGGRPLPLSLIVSEIRESLHLRSILIRDARPWRIAFDVAS